MVFSRCSQIVEVFAQPRSCVHLLRIEPVDTIGVQQGQLPMIFDRKEADQDDYQGAPRLGDDDGCAVFERIGIEKTSNQTGDSIDIAAEDKWHFVDQDVAYHTAGGTCAHAHDDAGIERESCIEGLLKPYYGEEPQSDGVEQEDCLGYLADELMQEQKRQDSQQHDKEIDPLVHPEGTDPNHHITYRASSNRGGKTDNECTKQIELLFISQAQA